MRRRLKSTTEEEDKEEEPLAARLVDGPEPSAPLPFVLEAVDLRAFGEAEALAFFRLLLALPDLPRGVFAFA